MHPSGQPTFVSQGPFLVGRLVRVLYVHNPFYLISAGLMLYGLHVAFRPAAGQLINPWALMAALCGYTLLLAATAWLIVRVGRVWEDARSLMVVLLLQFLALAISFDEIFNSAPAQANALLLLGLGFSIAVTELLCRGLGIRFPWLFRGPYYAVLALFFMYPAFVSPETNELTIAAIDLRIALFPVVAAIAFLTLIPAIRRGSSYVRDNGTPWGWPWFPWTAFGVLALGVCLRAYGLSLSFSPGYGMDSTFGLYYLVPFLLALLVLGLEIGIVENLVLVRNAVLWLAPALVLLLIPPSGGAEYQRFLAELTDMAGSPLFFTVVGLALFYGNAWRRGIRHCEWPFTAALLTMCVIGPRTTGIETLTAPQWWPLALFAGVQLILAVARRSYPRGFVAVCSVLAELSIAWHGTPFNQFGGAVPVHLLLGTMLAIGAVSHDRFAILLRKICAVALPLIGIVAIGLNARGAAETGPCLAYLAALTAISFAYWPLVRDRAFACAGAVSTLGVFWMTFGTLHGAWNRSVGARGFQPLVWAGICFVLAALISAFKAGIGRRNHSGTPEAPDLQA